MLKSLQITHLILVGLSGLILSLESIDVLQHSFMLSIYKLLSVGIIAALFFVIVKLTTGAESSHHFLLTAYKRLLVNKIFLVASNFILLSYFLYTAYTFSTTRELVFTSVKGSTIAIYPSEYEQNGVKPVATFRVEPGNPVSYRADVGMIFFEEITDEGLETRVLEVESIFQKWNTPLVICK